ncbi:MAG: ATP-binding protein [Chloroflexota bacterium]
MARVVRERIDPRLTAALFANYRTPIDALLELVDNAVDSRIKDIPLQVDLAIRPGTINLTVVGGTGMGPRELEHEYLRWGGSSKRAGERIGRFGQGGKAAVGHLGARFSIVASRAGDGDAYGFVDEAYRDRRKLRTYELHERPKPVARELGYVRIEIGAVDRKLDPKRVRSRLGDVYRPLLTSGEVVLRVDRAPVTPSEWPVEEHKQFSVRAGGRLVRGWYGLLTDPPPTAIEAGLRLYHLGRLVGAPEWFGHPGPAVHPALNRLIGEIELPHVSVTLNKSDIERGTPEWLAVEERLRRLLAPTIRQLMKEEAGPASPQALRTAEQVRRILAKALRLLESGQLFESDIGSGAGSGDRAQLTLDGYAERPSDDAEPQAEDPQDEQDEPKTRASDPPIRSGGPGRGARAGIAEVVIRALDPRLRSAMVEEDGVQRVVINSRYPLYEVRKGDLWYQLETALREVCVTIPEATVPEFERRVNELMIVSLGLADRPRRSRRRPKIKSPDLWPRG